ncbi:MAG: type II toxin-antitoxin system prevent-host-death family antitoxin [Cyanobacteria bacterium J06621_8]
MTQDIDSISTGEFKTHCLKLLDRVSKTKKTITITKHGKPMAKLTPIEEQAYSLFGCLKDTVEIKEDIIEGIESDWEVDV